MYHLTHFPPFFFLLDGNGSNVVKLIHTSHVFFLSLPLPPHSLVAEIGNFISQALGVRVIPFVHSSDTFDLEPSASHVFVRRTFSGKESNW